MPILPKKRRIRLVTLRDFIHSSHFHSSEPSIPFPSSFFVLAFSSFAQSPNSPSQAGRIQCDLAARRFRNLICSGTQIEKKNDEKPSKKQKFEMKRFDEEKRRRRIADEARVIVIGAEWREQQDDQEL